MKSKDKIYYHLTHKRLGSAFPSLLFAFCHTLSKTSMNIRFFYIHYAYITE